MPAFEWFLSNLVASGTTWTSHLNICGVLCTNLFERMHAVTNDKEF